MLPFQSFSAGLEPMLQAQSGNGLVPMGQQSGAGELVALAGMLDISGTISPTDLVAMVSETDTPATSLVAMDNRIEPAAAPLVAMDDRSRETQGALVAMVDAETEKPVELARAAPSGFGAVVGPVAAAEGMASQGRAMLAGGVGVVTDSLPPVGAAVVVASTLASVREAAAPASAGAEVLLELSANGTVLSSAIVAYRSNTAGDVMVPLSAISAEMGLGLEVDGAAGKATGWLASPDASIEIDMARGEIRLGKQRIEIEPGQVAQGGDEMFISAALLAQLLGGDMALNFKAMHLALNTPQPLAAALAKARAQAWAQATARKPAIDWMAEAKMLDYPFASLPNIGVDYSMGLQGGLKQARGLNRTDDALGLQLNGTLFYSNASLGFGLARNEVGDLRVTGGTILLSRDAPSPTLLADWLGPLAARRIDVGDIGATNVPLSTLGTAGRGVRMSNTPAGLVDDPERFVLEGNATPGWDVEVYQNAGLLAFQRVAGNGTYSFQALPLRPGVNEFRIVMYGPRGEQETRTARYVLGDAMLAKGQLTYDVSLYEPNTPVFELDTRQADPSSQPTLAQRYAYGLTSNMTAVVAAYTGLGGSATTLDAPANAVAAGLRGTVLGTYWQTEAMTSDNNLRRWAASVARQLPMGVGVRLGYANTSGATEGGMLNEQTYSAELSKMLKIGDFGIDNALAYRRTIPESGRLTDAVQLRTGLALGRTAITNEVEAEWREEGGANVFGDLTLSRPLLGGQLQTALSYRPKSANGLWQDVKANYNVGLTEKMTANLGYRKSLIDTDAYQADAGLTYQFEGVALGLRGTQSAAGDYGLRLNMATQLRPNVDGYGVYNPRQSGAGGGARVKLYVFVDDNGNEVADPGEVPAPHVMITNMNRNSNQTTNAVGEAVFTDIPANVPVRLEIQPENLPDIYLGLPKRPLVVYGQQGARGEYAIPLKRLGEVNGYVRMNGRDGQNISVSGVKLVAINTEGRIVARAKSESDGFYVLSELPLGTYSLALAQGEVERLGLKVQDMPSFTLTPKAYVQDDLPLTMEVR